ncbi:PREDICTED: enhancer of mRNA-decapping protein 4-like isoform X1 [Lupinus angustifolius]|uniref:enhancer of mRNA-decapping protein 4-like isoform X1 n=1 Tax=Lupinus angustifolius TaxID=3871 RepID=UPI00092E3068|nr:PREDICTED: enhancer of mRNA-decapping protein 4-like isoform X1 [Lupinus angustifolius]
MASPGNNPNQPPSPQPPFDMHSFFNPTNSNPNPNHNQNNLPFPPPSSSSSSYPLPTAFSAAQFYPQHPHFLPSYDHHLHHQQQQQQQQQQQHRSLSFPTPPLQPQPIPPPSNPNAGARLMALLSAPPQPSSASTPTPFSHPDFPTAPPLAMFTAANAAVGALNREQSSKIPKGRHLTGDHIVYDLDARQPGEVQPQLEVTPITKYGSDPNPVLGRQIAVNKSYICYGLKQGNIRVLNIRNAVRSLLRGHTLRVTDLSFFAEDVHLLASVGADGRVYVWKISEGQDVEDKPQITADIVIAIQIAGEENVENPRICWHCHKQEILIVGMGKYVLRIDTTKVGNGEAFVAEDPPRCPVDKLIDGVQLVGTHDGEVTDLSMCQWMRNRLVSASQDGTIKIWEDRKTQPLAVLRPHDGNPVFSATFLLAPHRPDHIVLITAGPQNRVVKLWVSASEEGWLLPSDDESWKCTQTLELMSSAQPCLRDAFFNQVAALPHAGLLLLANAQRNAIYAMHLEYGSYPESTRMDYIAEFTVTMPILSFTGTHDISPQGEHIVQVYCVQTQAIQQYALDLALCLPPSLDNMGLEKSDSVVSRDAITAEVFTSLESFAARASDTSLPSSAPKTVVQATSTESAHVARYPFSSGHIEAPASKEVSSSNTEAKPVTLAPSSSDADIVCVPSPPLPLSPRLSRKLSDFRNPQSNLGDHSGEQPVNDYSVDRQMDTIHRNLFDVSTLNNDSKIDEKKVKQSDISGVLNPSVMFKQPTHLVTPSEIIKAGSPSETNMIDRKGEGEAKIQDVTDVGNTEVEVKVVGEARSNQCNEFDLQGPQQNLLSDSKEKFLCSQASDLGIEIAQESRAITEEAYISEELGQDDSTVGDSLTQPSNALEDGLQEAKDVHEKVSDSSTSMTVPPSPSPNIKGKKQKGKISQASSPSSPSPSVYNLNDSSNEPSGSSSLLSAENASPQMLAMQESLNQLLSMQKEMQKQLTMMVAVPVTKEGRRLEASLGRSMDKAVKANTDALWARIQEENAKTEKFLRDRIQNITGLISNFINKDLPAMLEKTVKKEMASVGSAVVRSMSPAVEKIISSTIVESFQQRGVGDKAVNQLDKSVTSKLEATVARQIQAQFQTTGKQVLQDALKSSFETSVVPAFEMSCKAMFDQVNATFQNGMAEHSSAVQQRVESGHTSLAMTLRDSINSVSSVTQTLNREVVEGQRKLLALAAARPNSGTLNPLTIQLNSGPLLHEKVDVPLDPTQELSRLVSERKYEEAFTAALQRSDVSIVSWLCSQVDLHGLLSMVPLPLSQGVVLSLLQQLACDISNDTPRKTAWMTDVAAAINPSDPMITLHVRPIFEQVYQILNHQRSLPTMTGADLSSIRLLLHVINSMRMTCK